MKRCLLKFNLLLVFYLMAGIAAGQEIFSSVGIIGSATPNSWDASVPMKLADNEDPHQWTLTLRLTQGEVKFRVNDDWEVNWGSPDFPSGTGYRNGANIPIPTSSYYTVHFNDVTGQYHFETLETLEYNSLEILGDATLNGWDSPIHMEKDNEDPHKWTLDYIELTQNELKFRANNDWGINWGGGIFPIGTAFRNGNNIATTAGEYSVTFNDVTGDFAFINLNPILYQTVGIIGTATQYGWVISTPMKRISSGDPNNWTLTKFLQSGELKFRADDSWEVNWGGTEFPEGFGYQDGPNLQITESSYYHITFNDLTGAYRFNKLTPISYASIGIVGSATAGGWDNSTPMLKGGDGHTWTLENAELSAGEVKFRADNNWAENWGGNDFPTGVGIYYGPNIPVEPGFYNITFNDVTLEYDFEMVGEATGDIVNLTPAYPTAEEALTIIYDAGKGVSGLRGASKVYMHSGVVLSGPDGTEWNNVVGNWGQDDGIGEMTPVENEPDKWQISIPSIRDYYNVENGIPVFRLGMVFRNSNGTLEGKSATGGDIYINTDPGDFVRFTFPRSSEIFGLSGEQINISAEASGVADNILLEINDGDVYRTVAQETESQIISYDYTIGTARNLQMRVTAQIDGNNVTAERSLSINIRKDNTIAPLPAGMHNGINYHTDPSKATLVLLAPRKDFVYVVGDFNDWQVRDDYQMNQTPDGEYYWLELSGLEAQKAYVYQYWVDGVIKIGDPYADMVVDPFNDDNIPYHVYPNPIAYNKTEHGIATVLQTGQQPYEWKHPEVVGGRPNNENLMIYELLVRDFAETHSYNDVIEKLPYLKSLGINAIELLPIMQFENNESWGYNPIYLFAPDKYYGSKNDLKAFIDKAHEMGMVVILDMVLNHQFGQSPMVRMYWDQVNNRPSADSPWFNQEATHPFNVGFDMNHESPYTKQFVDDVNRYWIEEFKFDGYRYDLSKGFTQRNNPNNVGAWSAYDQSRIDILKRMADKLWETDPSAYVILEHFAANDEEKVLSDYGMMLWGNMNYAYSDLIIGQTETNLDWALSSTRGWDQKNLITYMESHDEERLMVRALNNGGSSGDYDIRQKEVALERIKMASAFFYPLPGPKMLWQFGELGYDFPIDFNGRTGNKPIPWGDRDGLHYDQDEKRMKLYRTKAAIINLVNDYSQVFEEGEFSWTPSGQFRRINISHPEMNVTIIGNFGLTEGNMVPGFQHTGVWYDFFTGSALEVTSTTSSTTLSPGEFHIFVDQLVTFPEPGLVKDYTPIEMEDPGNLTAELVEPFAVMLLWTDNAAGESGYLVERKSEKEQEFSFLTSLGENTEEYLDDQIIDGLIYQYRVKATSTKVHDSEWSNIAVIELPLLAPVGLRASIRDIRSIALQWEDRSSNETAYIVESAVQMGKNISPFERIAQLSANTTQYTDTNIRPGVTYHYKVFAKDEDEVSDYSNQVSIRTAEHIREIIREKLIKSISVHPNPVAHLLKLGSNLQLESPVHFQIMNMKGAVVLSFEVTPGMNQSLEVDVSQWKEGIYVLHVSYQDILIRQILMVRR